MPGLLWLPDVLRGAGLNVREIPGWERAGHGLMGEVLGVLCHHTGGPAQGLFPSERVVVQGRADLAGPLCNLGLDRAGTWVVVAAGSAWHAGTGSLPWCPRDQGNSRLIGVEAESTGRGDWTAAQLTSYPRGVAALLAHLRLPPERAVAHREWAPGRKIDIAGWPGDMPAFRASVAHAMFTPTGGDDMTPEQAQQLALLTSQLVTGQDPSKAWGWPTFPGGSGETLTVVDLLRRANAQLEDVKRRLAAVETGKTTVAGPAVLSDADLDRVAARVVALLGRKTST